jgi:hypothetical protein
MEAKLVTDLPLDGQWQYEPKWMDSAVLHLSAAHRSICEPNRANL